MATKYVNQYIREQYRRERKRVTQTIRRYKQKGYTVDIDIPKIPKKVTLENVSQLRRLTLDKIRENTYVNEEPERYQRVNLYGEIKLYQPIQVGKVAEDTQITIDEFLRLIKDYPPQARNMVEKWLQNVINTQGTDAAAEMLGYGQENGLFLNAQEVWSDQKNGYPRLMENMAKMVKYLDLSGGEKNAIFNDIEEEYGTDFGFYLDED